MLHAKVECTNVVKQQRMYSGNQKTSKDIYDRKILAFPNVTLV